MSDVWIFGYGSLLFQPELPDAILERRPARLVGTQRQFNKRSDPRGCNHDEAAWPEVLVPGFARPHRRSSLALGTRPGGHIDGGVIRYPAPVRRQLLALLHKREGYVPGRPRDRNSYMPREVDVDTPEGTVRAWSWFSIPTGDWHVELDLPTQARILVHATPRVDDGRGKYYLEHTRAALAGAGIVDPELEALWAEVLRAIPA